MDEREIEAVARAWWAHDPKAFDTLTPEWRALQMRRAEAAIAALDRVRDARGDDERSALNQTRCSGCTEAVRDEESLRFRSGVLWHEACLAARSPQGEDHEQDSFTIRWDDSMGCYRVSIPNYEGGEVVPIEVHRAALSRVSPSRVDSVAVEDVERLVEALRWYAESSHWRGPIYDRRSGRPTYSSASTNSAVNQDCGRLARDVLAEFSRSSTDRPEQPEPDVLGGQPPAEPGKPENG
jgi:hypothetical protein